MFDVILNIIKYTVIAVIVLVWLLLISGVMLGVYRWLTV